jgi:hypothetical protein
MIIKKEPMNISSALFIFLLSVCPFKSFAPIQRVSRLSVCKESVRIVCVLRLSFCKESVRVVCVLRLSFCKESVRVVCMLRLSFCKEYVRVVVCVAFVIP